MDAAISLDAHWIASNRLRASVELGIAVGVLEAELWSLRGWAPPWLNCFMYGLLVTTIVLSIARRKSEASDPVEPTIGHRGAWLEATITCALLAVLLVLTASLVGDANETFEFSFLRKPPLKLGIWVLGKFAAALGQQLTLQYFLWPVCLEITRSRSAGLLAAATIFGLVHLPSIVLVAITLLAGLVWVGLFQRSGRLAPLVASHMMLATLAHGGFPERLTYDMRVGITAVADQGRFASLENPKIRQSNRRLKEHREALRYFSSLAYYQTQGGNDPAFIRGLFRDILGRPATQLDVQFWQDQQLPQIRNQISSIFLASDEFAHLQARRQSLIPNHRREPTNP